MAVGFLFNWLKVAFRFLTKQHFSLAVASAIHHCLRLVGKKGCSLLLGRVASLGREVELHVLGWSPLSVKLVSALWFASENWLEIAVLSQLSQ